VVNYKHNALDLRPLRPLCGELSPDHLPALHDEGDALERGETRN